MNFQWKCSVWWGKRRVPVIEFVWWNYFSQHSTHTNEDHFEILWQVCGWRAWDASLSGVLHPHYCESLTHTNTIGSALLTTGCWPLMTPLGLLPVPGLTLPGFVSSFLPLCPECSSLLHRLFPWPGSFFPSIFKCYFLYDTPFLTIPV